MDDRNNVGQLEVYKTYLADGSVADRTIEWSDSTTGYAAFPVGFDILGDDYSQYEYPSSITEPAKATAVNWSSYRSSTYDKKDAVSKEFYTELGADNYSGVIYTSQSFWGSTKNSVVRYEGNLSSGRELVRSLSSISNSWASWDTETEEIEKTVIDNRISYSKSKNLWWASPADAATKTSSYRSELSLIETGADTKSYTGEMTEYWGSRGGTYDVILTNNNNGTYKLKRSGWSYASWSAGSSNLEMTIDQSDNFSFSLSVGEGTFQETMNRAN